MAGQGPAPKFPEERRNFSKPRRDEWLELPARNDAPAPKMPGAPRAGKGGLPGGWSPGTKADWVAWWADPASLTWSPADTAAVRALAYLHNRVERGQVTLANEVRLRLDGLGLSAKGKRDLRFRIVRDLELKKPKAKKPRSKSRQQYGHLQPVG